MNKIIYHNQRKEKLHSPFDSELKRIVANNAIKIACPYIGLLYLKQILSYSKNWVLLTDINKWIESANSYQAILEILEFIQKNIDRIKHCSSLHAKTVITPNYLYLGSTNFTFSGIFKNNEIAITITDYDEIQSANNWFDTWWKVSEFSTELQLMQLKLNCQETTEKTRKTIAKLPNVIFEKIEPVRFKEKKPLDKVNVLPVMESKEKTKIEVSNLIIPPKKMPQRKVEVHGCIILLILIAIFVIFGFILNASIKLFSGLFH